MTWGPPSDWWYNPSFGTGLRGWIRQHPVAHVLGGMAFFLLAALDVWAFRHLPVQWALAIVASEAQGTWEAIQVEVTPGYTWLASGIWDWAIATLIASLLALAVTLAA